MNIRNFKTDKELKDILKTAGTESLISLEKEYAAIELQRIKSGPQGNAAAELEAHKLWTRLITILLSLAMVCVILFRISPLIINNISKYQILKLGYQDVCDDYIKDEQAKKLVEDKFKIEVFKNGGLLVNGNIINAKKDTIIIKEK